MRLRGSWACRDGRSICWSARGGRARASRRTCCPARPAGAVAAGQQAALARAAGGGGGVADERQAGRAVRRQRVRVQERGPAPRLRAALHPAALPAARPAALRRDRRAADRHDDADGPRAAGHHVLQHRRPRQLRQRRPRRHDTARAAALARPLRGLLPRGGPRVAWPHPGRHLGRESRRGRDAGHSGQRDSVPDRLPASDPVVADAVRFRDRPRAVLLRRAEAVHLASQAADAEPAADRPDQQRQVDDHREVPPRPPACLPPGPGGDPGAGGPDAIRPDRRPVLHRAARRSRSPAAGRLSQGGRPGAGRCGSSG